MIDIMDWLTGWDRKASFEEELISLVLKCRQRTPCFALQDFSRAMRWPLQELASFLIAVFEPER